MIRFLIVTTTFSLTLWETAARWHERQELALHSIYVFMAKETMEKLPQRISFIKYFSLIIM